MSPSPCVARSRGLLPEFERLAADVTSSAAFRERFDSASRSGDRRLAISTLLESLTPLESLVIGDFHRPKDQERAARIFGEIEPVCAEAAALNVDKIGAILTEALLCARPRGELFCRLLLERARTWYKSGQIERCAKECRYFAEATARGQREDDADEAEWMEESRIDVLLLHSDCRKAQKAATESRNLLNEAMRRINELARRQCGVDAGDDSEDFKNEKAELLKRFLTRKQCLAPPRMLVNAEAATNQIEIPAVEGKSNDFLTSCSDALALGNDKVKGRMLYATRNIKPGSVLIVDRPFAFCTDIIALYRNCLQCHTSLRLEDSIRVPCENCQAVQFCSEICRQQAWDKFHKYECRIFDYFYANQTQKTNSLLSYRAVVTAAFRVQNNVFEIDQEFLKLHENDKDIIDINSLEKYESQDYKTVFNLETHCTHADPKDNLQRAIHSIFFAKCLIYSLNYYHPEVDNHERHLHILAVALLHNMQAINCNAYEIVENVRDDETKILEPRNVGGAIYTSVSLTNHSCYPNIVRHSFPCGTVVVKSLRFIPQGSEILDCYGQHFLENKRDSRRKLLAQKYHFECQCEPCLFDWPITLPSDKFNFKCKKCFKQCRRTRNAAECTACGQKTENSKLYALLQNSMKKRLTALTKMYDGNYQDALPLLLEHANCIDKILSEPSLEAVKTQQSIIQCLNAMSSTSV